MDLQRFLWQSSEMFAEEAVASSLTGAHRPVFCHLGSEYTSETTRSTHTDTRPTASCHNSRFGVQQSQVQLEIELRRGSSPDLSLREGSVRDVSKMMRRTGEMYYPHGVNVKKTCGPARGLALQLGSKVSELRNVNARAKPRGWVTC